MNTYSCSATKLFAPIFLGVLLFPVSVFASNIEVSPRVIDIKGRAREISHHSISVKNKISGILNVFVWAVDVDQAKGDLAKNDMSGSTGSELTKSPSRWVEISRSNSILPKEEQSIPLQLQIPGGVKPGSYHVSLKFSTGDTQSAAMNCTECTEDVALNIEVTEDVREKLQLFSFAAAKNIFTTAKADFSFSVENTGNKTLIPNGKIRIYDNSGKEVGLVDVNSEGKQIEPKAKDLLAASWAAKGKFGKYKAMLDVSYGQRGTMQDVVYFWVIPWSRFFGFMVAIAAILVITVMFLRGRMMARPTYVYEEYAPAEEDVVQPPLRGEEMVSRIGARQHQPLRLDDNLMKPKVNQITEVNLPARTRTVPPANLAVQLEQKKRTPSEEHIVRLR